MIKTGRHDTASFPEQRNHFFKRSRCFLFFRSASARRLLFGVIFHVFLEICQSQLLFSGQLFNGALPSHRLFSGRVSLIIYKSYRPFRLRVFRSITASVMCLQTFFQTVCPSCIQAPVCAFQHICIIHRSVFSFLPAVLCPVVSQQHICIIYVKDSRRHAGGCGRPVIYIKSSRA